jgi:ankyrin repeat protein
MKSSVFLITLLLLSACGKKAKETSTAPAEQDRELQDSQLSTNELLAHAVQTGQVDMARNTLAANANPNLLLVSGSTVLTYAIQFGHLDMVVLLLERGADPNKKDVNGRFPVILASQVGRDDIVKLLVTKEAHIDERDPLGRTVLMIAILRERWDLATWLINRNARIDVFDSQGATPMSLALGHRRTELVRLMENRLELLGGQSSAELLTELIEIGDVEGLQLLTARGPAILQTLHSPGPVSRAVQSPRTDRIAGMLEFFFEQGLSPDGTETDARTPLAEAARLNRVAVIDSLIKKGAQLEKLDQLSYSALYHGVAAAQPEAVAYLLEAGAKANYTTTKAGQTARLKACDVASAVTPIDRAERDRLEQVKIHLRCGYRRFLYW